MPPPPCISWPRIPTMTVKSMYDELYINPLFYFICQSSWVMCTAYQLNFHNMCIYLQSNGYFSSLESSLYSMHCAWPSEGVAEGRDVKSSVTCKTETKQTKSSYESKKTCMTGTESWTFILFIKLHAVKSHVIFLLLWKCKQLQLPIDIQL